MAGLGGFRPKPWRLLHRPRLLHALLFGPFVSAQFRLHGHRRHPSAGPRMMAATRLFYRRSAAAATFYRWVWIVVWGTFVTLAPFVAAAILLMRGRRVILRSR